MDEKEVDFVKETVNTHFVLAVVAVIISCFTGFWTIPMALASLSLSLRAQDSVQNNHFVAARQSAWWAALFGWLTVAVAVIPLLLILFFGGAILAFIGTLLSAA